MLATSCNKPIPETAKQLVNKPIPIEIKDSLIEKKPTSIKQVPIAKNKDIDQSISIKNQPPISTEFLMGKYKLSSQKLFIKIEAKYANSSNRYMHQEAYIAFKKMHAAAQKAGIRLKIISAARAYAQQKSIWEAKWTGKRKVEGKNLSKAIPAIKERALKILEFSSMPGTSRHHWGTDIDINALTDAYFLQGKGKKEYAWLVANAQHFGFYQPYTRKGSQRPNGYEEEKWHWSYLPLAQPFLKKYQERISLDQIANLDFKGAKSAIPINVIQHYVLGIADNCK